LKGIVRQQEVGEPLVIQLIGFEVDLTLLGNKNFAFQGHLKVFLQVPRDSGR
jgi:hypothetical protein